MGAFLTVEQIVSLLFSQIPINNIFDFMRQNWEDNGINGEAAFHLAALELKKAGVKHLLVDVYGTLN